MKTQQERDAANAARRLASRLARRNAAAEAMQRRQAAAAEAEAQRLSILTQHERAILAQAVEIQGRLARYDALRQDGALAVLELTARTAKALAAAGVVEVAVLAAMSDLDILSIPNLGRKALLEIRDALA